MWRSRWPATRRGRRCTCPTARGYTGQYQDATSGLDYYGARYYDPTLGQFTSADTLLARGLNRFGYVGGNPTSATDPSGHSSIIDAEHGSAEDVIPATSAVAGEAAAATAASGFNWGNGLQVLAAVGLTGVAAWAWSNWSQPRPTYQPTPDVVGSSGPAIHMGSPGWRPTNGQQPATPTSGDAGPYIHMGSPGWRPTNNRSTPDTKTPTPPGPQTQPGGGGSFGNGVPPLSAGGTCEGGESFAADTLVATPSGERPISSLRVGDQVKAYDPSNRTTSVQTVQHVFIDHDSDRLDVTLATTANRARAASQGDQVPHSARLVPVGTLKVFERDDQQANAQPAQALGLVGEVVHTTARHPWLTADRGWIRAGTLALGEPVVLADGSTATVMGLRAVAGAGDMWDLTVSNVHTFEVGVGSYVVHNCPPPNDDDSRLRGRSSKRSDAWIRQIARMKRLNPRDFGDYVESMKKGSEKGTLNDRGDFTWQQLLDLADDFIDEGGGN